MSHSQKDYTRKRKILPNLGLGALGLLVMAAIFVLDQASKYILLAKVVPQEWSLIRVTPFFNLNHAWNRGVSFSLFTATDDSRRWALVALALALCAVVGWWLRSATTRNSAIAYGMILGGAFGNICDRVVQGAVFDFLQFHLAGYYWPSFNLADSAIFLGVCLLLWESWRQSRHQRSGD